MPTQTERLLASLRDDRARRSAEYMVRRGMTPLRLAEAKQRLADLGYELDRRLDCHGNSRWMTGELAGESHPVITTSIRQADDKRSFAHFEARRDERFRALQKLRWETFIISRGAIISL